MELEHATDVEDMAIALFKCSRPVDAPVKEYLDTEQGTYTREIFMPANSIIIGEQHAKACINIITKGKLLIKKNVSDVGELIEVPDNSSVIFTGLADGRKIGYILEDTIFINVFHNVKATCLEEVGAELVIPSIKFNKFIKDKELAWHGQW